MMIRVNSTGGEFEKNIGKFVGGGVNKSRGKWRVDPLKIRPWLQYSD
jgi:hypothetical protein